MGEMLFSSDTGMGSPVPGPSGYSHKRRQLHHPSFFFFLPSVDRNKETYGKIMYIGRLVLGEGN